MGNVFSWEYLQPTFNPKTDLYDTQVDRSDPVGWIIPPKVKSPDGPSYTLDQINEQLTPLKFGDKKQLEFLAVLSEFKEALEDGAESHPGLLVA